VIRTPRGGPRMARRPARAIACLGAVGTLSFALGYTVDSQPSPTAASHLAGQDNPRPAHVHRALLTSSISNWTPETQTVSSDDTIACGDTAHCVTFEAIGATIVVKYTTDGGDNWQVGRFLGDPPLQINAVSCADKSNCFAAGDYLTSPTYAALWQSSDGGATWALVTDTDVPWRALQAPLDALQCLDVSSGSYWCEADGGGPYWYEMYGWGGSGGVQQAAILNDQAAPSNLNCFYESSYGEYGQVFCTAYDRGGNVYQYTTTPTPINGASPVSSGAGDAGDWTTSWSSFDLMPETITGGNFIVCTAVSVASCTGPGNGAGGTSSVDMYYFLV
jgi:hypothetical protein